MSGISVNVMDVAKIWIYTWSKGKLSNFPFKLKKNADARLMLIITMLYKMFENSKIQFNLNADDFKTGIDVSLTD